MAREGEPSPLTWRGAVCMGVLGGHTGTARWYKIGGVHGLDWSPELAWLPWGCPCPGRHKISWEPRAGSWVKGTVCLGTQTFLALLGLAIQWQRKIINVYVTVKQTTNEKTVFITHIIVKT